MARHNNPATPAISQHATGTSSVNTPREFGIAPGRGDGGGMSVLLSWHEKVHLSPSYEAEGVYS